ncbi:MAG: hypothetical protein DSM107014_12095 [Gomphosphaeria aponina SAG 52.96 = DSM 107014]|uniref:Uncharacterized protein n=1 Tax=Gomphosphaeria aponina SAG 52.96 = DSM 107014 TaxID=1521640 RepID=A0A941GSF1_9CHRO|nr:hypothetical protein [Gomphosphaeria aponina SAG 52.96 = DSM 107014]
MPKLGETQIQQWQQSGYLSVYHYGEGKLLPLHYQFLLDLIQYEETQLQQSVPTLILHGINDDVTRSNRLTQIYSSQTKLTE